MAPPPDRRGSGSGSRRAPPRRSCTSARLPPPAGARRARAGQTFYSDEAGALNRTPPLGRGIQTSAGSDGTRRRPALRIQCLPLWVSTVTFIDRPLLRLNDILDRISGYHPDPDLDVIKKAYVYSAKVHQGQIRKSGEPYLIHPLEVAGILAEMRLDEASVVAGLLHDTIEDTLAKPEEIHELFGPEVLALVEGVTKLGTFSHGPRTQEEKQAENFRKMLVAMAKDIRVILVKL